MQGCLFATTNISSVEGRTNLSLTINLLSSVKSPQMRICPDFLVTTTIGAHHSVASSTLDIIPFSSIVVNSFLTLLNNGNGTRRGADTAKGLASEVSLIRCGPPTITLNFGPIVSISVLT